ncbi:hypothetical protein [Anaerotignum sp.]
MVGSEELVKADFTFDGLRNSVSLFSPVWRCYLWDDAVLWVNGYWIVFVM